MARYIDADALIQLGLQDGAYEYVSVQEIADFPAADVVDKKECSKCVFYPFKQLREQEKKDMVEVVHGEWIPIDVGDCCYRCSVCNFVRDAYLLEEDNYCPHCGAKMGGEK